MENGAIIVIAANDNFFQFMKASIYDIRYNLGNKTKIIGYDLGGISENKQMINELNNVCNFELRIFNFTILPLSVRKLTIFAWKIVIIAEILKEYPTMIYADASVRLYYDGFNNYFDRIEDETISGLQMPSNGGHKLYKYIPHYWEEISSGESLKEMHEANFMIIHRNEYTRKLLKWLKINKYKIKIKLKKRAILCAYTLECIDPPGAKINCEHPYIGIAKCHRQDQKQEILIKNKENGKKFYSHYDDQNPRIYPNGFFGIMRRLPLRKNLNFEKAVKCN
ncbi:hypothetical protein Mgra_00000080 [Meloidogyne graminicola]|uniref:Uncharacterized protein n=1 Tax=Meloidogyne graminicola TaxID=189291 RepID=A0A8T0A2C7_9BILA|nr:hypothetical protein Mgra_00000080 [Meloidogyne graminicola]